MLPELGESTQAFFRLGYGVLLLGTLLMALPHWRRFFQSERWGGYAQSSWSVDLLQNPYLTPALLVLWLACGILITIGVWAVWVALANLLLCRYFFVHLRWKGVLRGMGAPGFMTYWLAAVVFLLEFTSHYAPMWRGLAVLVAQADFALIILSAGVYKFTAGYPRNEGMEYGMVNPQWGYWGRFYQHLSPRHPLFWFLNQMAWLTQVVSAVLMLIPATRFVGALLIVGSFAFIATHIRLGLLCEMVMLCGVLFFAPGTLGAAVVDRLAIPPASAPAWTVPTAVSWVVGGFLVAYLALLPLAHAGLFYNYYARRSLPRPLQRFLEAYCNFFGIIIWRVFSVDHTSFCVLIHRQPRNGRGPRELLSDYLRFGGRFNHVGESITVTSLFTTLKYYPSQTALFAQRVLRYARTVPCPDNEILVFEYRALRKTPRGFESVPVAEYRVDVPAATVTEVRLDAAVDVRRAHAVSPVHEGVRPGSYLPLGA